MVWSFDVSNRIIDPGCVLQADIIVTAADRLKENVARLISETIPIRAGDYASSSCRCVLCQKSGGKEYFPSFLSGSRILYRIGF